MLHEIVPQAARWRAGQPVGRRRRRAADRRRRPVHLQPGHAAEGRFPGDGHVGVFVELLGPGAGAAAAVRQGEVRDLDRGDALLPERRLHACRRRARAARCCAASRPTATAWPGSTRPCPKAPQGMPGVIVPRKTVGELRKLLDDDEAHDRRVGVGNEGALCHAGHHADLQGHRRHLPRLHPRHPHRQHPAAGGGRQRIRQGGGPRGHGVVGTLARGEAVAGRRPAGPVGQRARTAAPPRRNWPSPMATSGWRSASTRSTCWKSPARWTARMRCSCSTPSGDPTLMREGNDLSAVYVVMPMRV